MVEIDWIRLTGVEEQLQGELPPPVFTGETPSGDLFAPASFCPVGTKGVGGFPSPFAPAAVLGDLDGDGDVDLDSVWQSVDHLSAGTGTAGGLLFADNTGAGVFARPQRSILFSSTGSWPSLCLRGGTWMAMA